MSRRFVGGLLPMDCVGEQDVQSAQYFFARQDLDPPVECSTLDAAVLLRNDRRVDIEDAGLLLLDPGHFFLDAIGLDGSPDQVLDGAAKRKATILDVVFDCTPCGLDTAFKSPMARARASSSW